MSYKIVDGRRERQFDGVLEDSNTRTLTACSPTAPTYLSYAGGLNGPYRFMTDYVTPRFTQRSNSGEIVNKPCTKLEVNYSTERTGYEHTRDGFPSSCGTYPGTTWKDHNEFLLGRVFGNLDWKAEITNKDNAPWVDLRSEASTKALSYVKKPDVSYPTVLGEIRGTLRMLRNPIKALTDLTRKHSQSIKREATRQRRRARELQRSRKLGLTEVELRLAQKDVREGDLRALQIAQGAGNQYLTWLYGVRPLLQDIEGTLDALFHDNWSPRHTARGKAVWQDTTVDEIYQSIGSPLTGIYMTRTVDVRAEVRAGFLYEHTFDLQDRLGWNASSVPAALWELVPYSFLVDQVVNVGQTLKALVAAATTRPLAQWISERAIITVTRQVTDTGFDPSPPGGGNWTRTIECRDKDSVVIETYSREPNVQLWTNIALRSTFVTPDLGTGLAHLSLLLQKLK